MDMSYWDLYSDLVMEDPTNIIQHCQMMMNTSQQVPSEAYNNLYDPTHYMLLDTKTTSLTSYDPQLPPQQPPTNSGWSSCASSTCNTGQLISFGSSKCDNNSDDDDFNVIIKSANYKEEPIYCGDDDNGGEDYFSKVTQEKQKKRVISSSTSKVSTQEHVLAERKRREKMACRFHALSALIPGLKKMDKASILEDAAKYLKQLEQEVKQLEEQTSKRIVESVVLVKKMQHDNHHINHGNSFSDDSKNDSSSNNPFLEIEAKASNKNVLIRIHTRKLQGLTPKVLREIEKLHLTTLNCNTMPFGGYATDITIVAKMNDEFNMTTKDLVKNLRIAVQQFS